MTKLVVLIGFCVAFAAGLAVGISRGRVAQTSNTTNTPPTTHPSRRGFLPSELNLTQEQQEKLSKIWSDVARGGRGEQEERRLQLRQKRDEAIAALIPADNKAKYEQALKDYNDQVSAMNREMRERFEKAVKATEEILTPEQRAKYKEILSRHSPGGPGRPGSWGRDRETTRRSDSATSQPAH